MLQIETHKESTSSPDENYQYCSRNIAINIQSDSIVRHMHKVHLLTDKKYNHWSEDKFICHLIKIIEPNDLYISPTSIW